MTLRHVMVMLVLAVLAVVAFYLLETPHTNGNRLPPAVEDFHPRDVAEFKVVEGENEAWFRRRLNASDVWELHAETAWVRARSAQVEDMVIALARQPVSDRFDADSVTPGDRAGFGLAEPSFEVRITLPRGNEVVWRYGDHTLGAKALYMDTGEGTDVWVVGGDAYQEIRSSLSQELRDRRLTTFQTFDVSGLRVEYAASVVMEVEKDLTYVWRITEPFAGYADPHPYETRLAALVNATVDWVEDGAQDLAKYGLADPRGRVVFKRLQAAPVTLLLGNETEAGGVFVMEEGTDTVAHADKRFLQAVKEPAAGIRDRAFSRLGIGGVAITVKLGDLNYELRKEGDWEIWKPVRLRADGDGVERLLEDIRSWATVEFLDDADPADHGIDPENGDRIVIERQNGETLTLLVGRSADEHTVYAQRKGDGGVERVMRGPLTELLEGYAHFRTDTVRTLPPGEVIRIERAVRPSADSEVQELSVKRAFIDNRETPWVVDTVGVLGSLDLVAISDLLARLNPLTTPHWLLHNPTLEEPRGFRLTTGSTCTLSIEFEEAKAPSGGARQTLLIGNPAPDGGYYARFAGDGTWAFILSDEVVRFLTAPLTKAAPPTPPK